MCRSDKAYSPKELARAYPALFTERRLRHWRAVGVGPTFVRPAGTAQIAYLDSDVQQWLSQSKRTADEAHAPEALPAAIEHLATVIAQLPAAKRKRVAAQIGGACR